MGSLSITRNQIWAMMTIVMAAALGMLIYKTHIDLLPIPDSLTLEASKLRKVQVLDRHGSPLTVTYQNRWNIHDYVPLHEIPRFLRQAFVISEDQRFYRHHGVDWRARWHALFQNLKALHAVRGASTITEQVIRMWHPRPRTVWSRWLEGIEAGRLEKQYCKAEILEFYLNQVPYAGQRRGVVQAARYYFDRDLDTLNQCEMLALVVMVRAPGRLNIHRQGTEIKKPVGQLAQRLLKQEIIHPQHYQQILAEDLHVETSELPVRASHFVHYLYQTESEATLHATSRLRATLDSALQSRVQTILDERLKGLQRRNVKDGAVLVVDHRRHEILAWVNASENDLSSWIDAVTTARQPGSTLKPFVYAMALEKGWTAATRLDDLPLAKPVGLGLHTYKNYSRTHYGSISLRQALGNSLNIPAVQAIQFVGIENFLNRMHALGIHSLKRHPDYYGDGLVLGNGEISLLELVGAYAVLAGKGIYLPLKLLMDPELTPDVTRRIFSPEVSALIGNILSDPVARQLEFGEGSLLRLPVETAIKTGTSNDYRDAWAVGFNWRFTVGVWMGNLDATPMQGVTGSIGPALVLRAVFAELNRHRDTRPLYLSPKLVKIDICRDTGQAADGRCPAYSEWFIPGTVPRIAKTGNHDAESIYLVRPTAGLQLSMDPRIPDEQEAFAFELSEIPKGARVDWWVDDKLAESTEAGQFLWPMKRGVHFVRARLWRTGSERPVDLPEVKFIVK